MDEKKNMKEIIKSGVRLVTGIGCGAIVANAVVATTPAVGVGLLAKACIGMAKLATGGMLGEAAGKYTDKTIDELCDSVKIEIKNPDDESEPEVVEAEVVG